MSMNDRIIGRLNDDELAELRFVLAQKKNIENPCPIEPDVDDVQEYSVNPVLVYSHYWDVVNRLQAKFENIHPEKRIQLYFSPVSGVAYLPSYLIDDNTEAAQATTEDDEITKIDYDDTYENDL